MFAYIFHSTQTYSLLVTSKAKHLDLRGHHKILRQVAVGGLLNRQGEVETGVVAWSVKMMEKCYKNHGKLND